MKLIRKAVAITGLLLSLGFNEINTAYAQDNKNTTQPSSVSPTLNELGNLKTPLQTEGVYEEVFDSEPSRYQNYEVIRDDFKPEKVVNFFTLYETRPSKKFVEGRNPLELYPLKLEDELRGQRFISIDQDNPQKFFLEKYFWAAGTETAKDTFRFIRDLDLAVKRVRDKVTLNYQGEKFKFRAGFIFESSSFQDGGRIRGSMSGIPYLPFIEKVKFGVKQDEFNLGTSLVTRKNFGVYTEYQRRFDGENNPAEDYERLWFYAYLNF
jgi:hypothetical protein